MGDWIYSDEVKRHFLEPKNWLMGEESEFDFNARGLVGNVVCGDQMLMLLRIEDEVIVDARWKTYGCASAIASTSALSEMIKGKTLDEALAVSPEDIAESLGGLPKHKFHCSVLGDQALQKAIEDYRKKR
jgi:nitrogen fixation NifU-like protein